MKPRQIESLTETGKTKKITGFFQVPTLHSFCVLCVLCVFFQQILFAKIRFLPNYLCRGQKQARREKILTTNSSTLHRNTRQKGPRMICFNECSLFFCRVAVAVRFEPCNAGGYCHYHMPRGFLDFRVVNHVFQIPPNAPRQETEPVF